MKLSFSAGTVIFVGAIVLLIAVAAVAIYLYLKKRNEKPADVNPAAPAAGGVSEIDDLVKAADRRLAQANAGTTIANLPLIFVIGDRSTAKTSTVVNSGIEPELVAGQLYQDSSIAPTQTANLWFSRGTALVEAGGAVLADPANWMRLVKRLQPGKLKSLKGGSQSPRAMLLCVSMETFTQQGAANALATASRYLQSRLAEVAQTLGIRFPVYVLFTKTDRVPFFTEFVGAFSNEEAGQVFGVTVPIRSSQQSGVYADDETRRLTSYFDNLFYSLCDKRTIFPPRQNEPEKVCAAYEFPREMRKVRDAMVQFMVDVCRPSQLTTSPFLRGFYFTGVRPIVINDAAPIMASREQISSEQASAGGATGMFRVGRQAEMKAQQSVAQPIAASRKVPQWMFLAHLFDSIILGDSAAMSASGSSVKVSALRRGLLIAASVASLILAGIFLASFLGNRSLETEALKAAQSIPTKELAAGALPSLASLQQLENLRQSLETLEGYESGGAPYHLRWGLYQGSNMLPQVRLLYFGRFRALLFGQTQTGMLRVMQGLKSPPGPNDEYGYPYDTLKGYLLTTSEYRRASDKSLQDFLGSLLFARWTEKPAQEIGKNQKELAKKQFDYYSHTLPIANPYSDKSDAESVDRTRVYLSGFKGVQRVYHGVLANVAKRGKGVTFNQWAEGSSATLTSTYPVAYAFTKDGEKAMQDDIKQAKFAGEKWVLGDSAGQLGDTSDMQKAVSELYQKDYINQWRSVLKPSHIVPYTSLKDAAEKLDKLTRSDAPILALFSWTTQNTTLADMPEVNDAFKAAHQIEPPGAPAYVPSAQPYNDALQNLQAAVAKAAEPNADPSTAKTAMEAADAARQATRKITAALPLDREGQVDAMIAALMLEPITDAERLLKGLGASDLNGKGGAFCGSFGPITKKFPFNSGAPDDATLEEIAEIFKPSKGKLWVFYEGGLKKVMDCSGPDCKLIDNAPLTVNPTFLRFFNQAVKFSRALYGDSGSDPNFHYSLKPQKSDQVSSFDLTVNGEPVKLEGGMQKSFVWPGQKHNFKLDLELASGGVLEGELRDTLWSAFRFFADADRTVANGASYDFYWSLRQGRDNKPVSVNGHPLTYTFTFEANGAPAIFSKEFLAGMKCVPVVAK